VSEPYYIQPIKSSRISIHAWRVIEAATGIAVFADRSDEVEIFHTYEAAQECCEYLNEMESK
jgi:hypothetical protein